MAGNWSEERRQKARERIMETRPWLKSTGAKTPLGKAIVGKNSLKHGLRARLPQTVFEAVALQLATSKLMESQQAK